MIHIHCQSSPSTTTNAMLSASSHISALPTMPTSHARLKTRVWANPELSVNTKDGSPQCQYLHCCMTAICQTGYTTQQLHKLPEKHPSYPEQIMTRKNVQRWFHVLCLSSSVYPLLKQCRLRWLGHDYRMEDSHTEKIIGHAEGVQQFQQTWDHAWMRLLW